MRMHLLTSTRKQVDPRGGGIRVRVCLLTGMRASIAYVYIYVTE